jgi:hypothetical protein
MLSASTIVLVQLAFGYLLWLLGTHRTYDLQMAHSSTRKQGFQRALSCEEVNFPPCVALLCTLDLSFPSLLAAPPQLEGC